MSAADVPPLFDRGAWDDSALVRAFDGAVADYVRAHAAAFDSADSDSGSDSDGEQTKVPKKNAAALRGVQRGDLMRALQAEERERAALAQRAELDGADGDGDGDGGGDEDGDGDDVEDLRESNLYEDVDSDEARAAARSLARRLTTSAPLQTQRKRRRTDSTATAPRQGFRTDVETEVEADYAQDMTGSSMTATSFNSGVRVPPPFPALPEGVPPSLQPLLIQYFYAGWHAAFTHG
jgi:Survival Motor Neuron, Gemin2-binding domain